MHLWLTREIVVKWSSEIIYHIPGIKNYKSFYFSNPLTYDFTFLETLFLFSGFYSRCLSLFSLMWQGRSSARPVKMSRDVEHLPEKRHNPPISFFLFFSTITIAWTSSHKHCATFVLCRPLYARRPNRRLFFFSYLTLLHDFITSTPRPLTYVQKIHQINGYFVYLSILLSPKLMYITNHVFNHLTD